MTKNKSETYDSIILTSNVNNEMLVKVLSSVEESDEDTIKIYINSFGGDLFAGIAIYSFLKHCNKKIITINTAIVASSAILIFLAGEFRSCYNTSFFMFHEWTNSCQVPMRDIMKEASNCNWLMEEGKNIYRKELLLEDSDIERIVQVERRYVYPDEAERIKLVHEVIG